MSTERTTTAQGSVARALRHRILVVDDHPIVLSGLRRLLEQEPDMTVCGEAGNAADALRLANTQRPDLVLLDISLNGPNGIELTKRIRQLHPDLPVLILSMHDESLYAERALRSGASGYIMKHEPPQTLLGALRHVLSGKVYLSAAMSAQLVSGLVGHTSKRATGPGIGRLSDRELEILDFVGRAWTTRAIAEKLALSVKTVEAHKSNIKRKLNLRTVAELTRYAVQWVEGRNP